MRSGTLIPAAALLLALFAVGIQGARRSSLDPEPWLVAPWDAIYKWTPPDFCHSKDCPEFAIKETADDVELREYVPAHWINTNVTNAKFGDAWKEGTKRLDAYRNGDNKQGAKVDQTLPTVTILYPAPTGRTFSTQFTVEYFVPFELQDSPPEPTAVEVGILKVPVQQVWVKVFGGFADESSVTQQAFDFLDELTKQGKKVSRAAVGYAQYDPLTTLINRHNEIWVWPEQQPTTSN